MHTSKIAAFLSFMLAICYIVGLFQLSASLGNAEVSVEDRLNILIAHKLTLQLWYLLIYVLFGLLLIPFSAMLSRFFKGTILNRITSVMGYIWAAFVLASGFIFIIGIEKVAALSMSAEHQFLVWTSLEILQDAFGGGIELLGGIWVFLIGVNRFKNQPFHFLFNGFSLALGLIGIATIFAFFYDLGGVFGVLQILWFMVLGMYLYRLKVE